VNHTVILHDARRSRWLRFADPIDIVIADTLNDVVPALRALEARVNEQRLHAAGFLSYDAAPAFDRALAAQPGGALPLLWFGLYRAPEVIAPPAPIEPSAPLAWAPTITRPEFDAAIARIKDHIADGDTYQVNYTFRLRATVDRSPWDLFRELVHAQPAAYSAFVDTGRHVICSVSPELFFDLDAGTLTGKPMKGTARRGRFLAEDVEREAWLHTSAKNRAENVMIVDMIRNDIGRVAEVGSVHVSDLFHVERYPTVWQMTSTVTGQTRASVTDIMAALFPCASITGAPKARTTDIIAALESTPRGLYTGAIGFIAPERRAQFSVAIRTVMINTATRAAEYGVGGGVTWESDAADEYEECLTKARVLTEPQPLFQLLETMRWSPDDGFVLLDEHLARVQASATYFDIPFDEAGVRHLLARSATAFATDTLIVRLLIDRDGTARCESAPLVALREPVRLMLAATPIESADRFLFHKTTNRARYDQARQACPGADDVVLWNERGEVTETCIANIVADIDGALYTPPLDAGLLPGTYRSVLLARGDVTERVITVDELRRSAKIYVINSVRGGLDATLVGAPS